MKVDENNAQVSNAKVDMPDGTVRDTREAMDRRLWPVGFFALIVAVFIAFLPAMNNGFVWDDRPLLIENWENLGFGFRQILWAFTSFRMGHYQPLTWLSFSIDQEIWGHNAFGFHLTNIILHAANAVLFATVAFSLLRAARMRRGDCSNERLAWGALVAAAMFALHPLRVESVAWVAQRRDVLSGLFFLVSVRFYLQAAYRGRDGGLHARWRAASVVAFCLSLLSKSLVVGLPIVLLVLDVYPLRRLQRGRPRGAIGNAVVEKIPYLVAAALALIVAVIAQTNAGALISTDGHSVTARIAQAAYGIVFYLKATFASLAWYPLHERPWKLDPSELRFVVSAGVVLAATAVLLLFRRRFPAGLAAWVCYIVLLLPTLGAAQSGVQLVADRFSYLSCMAWAVLAGAGVAAGWPEGAGHTFRRRTLAVGVIAVLCLCGALTWRQTQVWHDEERLWRHALGAGPSRIARNNLGVIALAAGDTAAAIEQFARALEIVPAYATARSNLILATATLNVESDSVALVRSRDALARSLQRSSADAPTLTALGRIEAALNRHEQAITYYQRALNIDPKNADTWRHLGLARFAEGDAGGAMDACRRAVAVDPNLGEAWLLLGITLVTERRFDDGRAAFERATRLLPNNSSAWTGLGTCLLQAKDLDGAVAALRQAVTLDPGNAHADKMLNAIQRHTSTTGRGDAK